MKRLSCGGCLGNTFWGRHTYAEGCTLHITAGTTTLLTPRWSFTSYGHPDGRLCDRDANGAWWRREGGSLVGLCERLHNSEGGSRSAFEVALDEALGEVRELMISRHAKYGPGNIAEFGELGLLVRLSDKLARLRNNMDDFSDESVDDAVMDCLGYSVIWMIWRRGKWPS